MNTNFIKSCAVLLSIGLITLSGCDSRHPTVQKLEGHWHSIQPSHYDMTLDIEDSVVTLNQYSLVEYSEQFPLFDSVDHSIVLPIYCGCGGSILSVINKFYISNDTLTYDEEMLDQCYAFKPLKFVKSDPEKCRWTHALSGRSPNVELLRFPTQTSRLIDLDSIQRNSAMVPLMVGFPTKKKQWGTAPKIQANDVFIDRHEVPLYLDHVEKSFMSSVPVSVCLIIDASVPASFVDDLLGYIPANLTTNIYQLVSSQGETKLGYQKMKSTKSI